MEKRKHSIKIRVTEAELLMLHENKQRPELARWMRELGLENCEQPQIIKHQLPPEVVRVLAGIGGNLNQISRHINTAAKVGDLDLKMFGVELLTQLAATERALNQIRDFIKNDS